MSRPSHKVMQSCAAAIDGLRVPHGYDANIVMVNRLDRSAHIFVGASDARAVAAAMEDLIADPDQVGIVNRSGVKLEI